MHHRRVVVRAEHQRRDTAVSKGKPLSQAHRFKISQALMGNKNGKGRPKAREQGVSDTHGRDCVCDNCMAGLCGSDVPVLVTVDVPPDVAKQMDRNRVRGMSINGEDV